jgi:hypothetical protein
MHWTARSLRRPKETLGPRGWQATAVPVLNARKMARNAFMTFIATRSLPALLPWFESLAHEIQRLS